MSDVPDFAFFDRDRVGINLEHVTAWQPVPSRNELEHRATDGPRPCATQVLLSDGHTIVLQVSVEQFADAIRQATDQR